MNASVDVSKNQTDLLKRLRIPKNLKGKSFLEIGCGDGFNCVEAQRRGAKYVTGVDTDIREIEEARLKDTSIQFTHVINYEQLDYKTYDVILARLRLEEIQYPIEFLTKIHQMLDLNGLFILECEVGGQSDRSMRRALHGDRDIIYPSMETIKNIWLKDFSPRYIGRSVNSPEDPVNRHIFHNQRRMTTVVFITGDGGTGKTDISNLISRDAVVIHTDTLFNAKTNKRDHMMSDEEKKFIDAKKRHRNSIKRAWEEVKKDDNLIQFIVNTLSKTIKMNRGASLIIVEGYILKDIIKKVEADLNKSFKTWVMSNGEFSVYKNKIKKIFNNILS